jgi:hypothetical protein
MNTTTLIHLAFDLALLVAVVLSYLTLRDRIRVLAIKLHESKALIDRLNHWHFLRDTTRVDRTDPQETPGCATTFSSSGSR